MGAALYRVGEEMQLKIVFSSKAFATDLAFELLLLQIEDNQMIIWILQIKRCENIWRTTLQTISIELIML